MNEKIKEIENVLMDLMNVSLAKQCKQEYIIYTFYTNPKRQQIVRQTKEHFDNRELDNPGKCKKRRVEIPIDKFLNDVVYDLLNRGYELELFEE